MDPRNPPQAPSQEVVAALGRIQTNQFCESSLPQSKRPPKLGWRVREEHLRDYLRLRTQRFQVSQGHRIFKNKQKTELSRSALRGEIMFPSSSLGRSSIYSAEKFPPTRAWSYHFSRVPCLMLSYINIIYIYVYRDITISYVIIICIKCPNKTRPCFGLCTAHNLSGPSPQLSVPGTALAVGTGLRRSDRNCGFRGSNDGPWSPAPTSSTFSKSCLEL